MTLIFKIVGYLILDFWCKQNQFLIHPSFIQMSRKDQCTTSKHFCVKSFFLDSVEQEKLCLMIISGQLLFTHTKKIFEALYDVLPHGTRLLYLACNGNLSLSSLVMQNHEYMYFEILNVHIFYCKPFYSSINWGHNICVRNIIIPEIMVDIPWEQRQPRKLLF